ncbi:hypothetical protein [Candidatus Bathycorpusculum sp.]|nr:hypothetical protein [Candidatus Termitimicrobium sp.]
MNTELLKLASTKNLITLVVNTEQALRDAVDDAKGVATVDYIMLYF